VSLVSIVVSIWYDAASCFPTTSRWLSMIYFVVISRSHLHFLSWPWLLAVYVEFRWLKFAM